jgi:putative flippase GtrA
MRAMIDEHFRPLMRFALVGVLNTGVYYGIYLLLVQVAPYLVAHVVGWFVSISFSFLMNCRFTYHVRPTWKRYLLFPLSNLPNILFTSVGVVGLVELLHVNVRLAPLIAGICAIPFSYLLGSHLMRDRDPFSDVEASADGAVVGTTR